MKSQLILLTMFERLCVFSLIDMQQGHMGEGEVTYRF